MLARPFQEVNLGWPVRCHKIAKTVFTIKMKYLQNLPTTSLKKLASRLYYRLIITFWLWYLIAKVQQEFLNIILATCERYLAWVNAFREIVLSAIVTKPKDDCKTKQNMSQSVPTSPTTYLLGLKFESAKYFQLKLGLPLDSPTILTLEIWVFKLIRDQRSSQIFLAKIWFGISGIWWVPKFAHDNFGGANMYVQTY